MNGDLNMTHLQRKSYRIQEYEIQAVFRIEVESWKRTCLKDDADAKSRRRCWFWIG